MNKLEIVVIGSGASALAAVRELLESKIDMRITVLDPGNQREPDQKIGLKSYFGSLNMYDQEFDNLSHTSMRPVVWPSASFGGFTRIWGATIDEDSIADFANYIQFYGQQNNSKPTPSAQKLIKRIESAKKPHWKILNHRLAVDPKRCTMCGDCLTGCPTDAIWFAGDKWKELENIQIRSGFRVREIVQNEMGKEIKSYGGQVQNADLVFLAAGPISSAQILMRSSLIPLEVEFRDTQAIFFPAIKFPSLEGERSFALSQLSAYLETSEGNECYLQVYPDSRNISQSIKLHKPYIGSIVSFFWRYISPFVATGILYLDSKISPGLLMRMIDEDKFELIRKPPEKPSQSRLEVPIYIKSIKKEFGIFPLIRVGKIAEPGESYHFGSSSEIKKLNQDPNLGIRVVDSSSLSEVRPGPITSRVMSNSRRIVRETLREYK